MKRFSPSAPRVFSGVPGVGPSIEGDLLRLGVKTPEMLARSDPQDLFDRLCRLEGKKVDRCVLYVFRCAVYCCKTPWPDPERAKWWNWSDANLARRRPPDANETGW